MGALARTRLKTRNNKMRTAMGGGLNNKRPLLPNHSYMNIKAKIFISNQ